MPWWRGRPVCCPGDDRVKAAVIGAGTMGRGIAQVFAQSGHDVVLTDMNQEVLPSALKNMGDSLERLRKKSLIEEDPAQVLSRIRTVKQIDEIGQNDIYIEAIFEKLNAKMDLFRIIDRIAPKSSIIASNTSSISINLLSTTVKAPGRFIGMHFFNPVPVMKLVEIIKAERTEQSTVESVVAIARGLGKEPVTSKDFPGFISNRILMPILKEAMLCLQEGVSTAQEIDRTAKLGLNHPMGPLELSDFIGLDVVMDIMEVLYTEFGEERFKPPIILRNMVNSGMLGRKSGIGFYRYGEE